MTDDIIGIRSRFTDEERAELARMNEEALMSPQQRAAITRKKNAEAKKQDPEEKTEAEKAAILDERLELAGIRKMNNLALRIFDGQSPDLPKKVRVERIVSRLKSQGFSQLDKLELPIADFKRFV